MLTQARSISLWISQDEDWATSPHLHYFHTWTSFSAVDSHNMFLHTSQVQVSPSLNPIPDSSTCIPVGCRCCIPKSLYDFTWFYHLHDFPVCMLVQSRSLAVKATISSDFPCFDPGHRYQIPTPQAWWCDHAEFINKWKTTWETWEISSTNSLQTGVHQTWRKSPNPSGFNLPNCWSEPKRERGILAQIEEAWTYKIPKLKGTQNVPLIAYWDISQPDFGHEFQRTIRCLNYAYIKYVIYIYIFILYIYILYHIILYYIIPYCMQTNPWPSDPLQTIEEHGYLRQSYISNHWTCNTMWIHVQRHSCLSIMIQ